jgi:endonuclease-3
MTQATDPKDIEQDLMALLPREQWTIFAHRMIWHGRRICTAKNPDHEHCLLAPICPTATLIPAKQLAPKSRARR